MMTHNERLLRLTRISSFAVAAVMAAGIANANAQSTPAPQSAPPMNSVNVSPQILIKLIETLVANNSMTREQADELVRAAANMPAQAPIQEGVPATGMAQAPAEPGTIIVPYVPQSVRNQIKKELRDEVVNEAFSNGWAAPNALPEWTKRFKIYGDIRVRAEGVFQGEESSPFFSNYNAINGGTGFDTQGALPPPLLNTTEDRKRVRMRARLGFNAQVADWVSADVRLATGNDSSPVSTNQTFGGGGNLSKYNIWLDRASIRFTPYKDLKIDLGRAENPFWTTDLLFDTDLNFDGLSGRYTRTMPFADTVSLFGTAGAFPVYNTDFAFGNNAIIKTASRDKYLVAGQLGFEWKPTATISAKFAAGYFDFLNISGQKSAPCFSPDSTENCNTDISRSQFSQFGNTVFGIRDITFIDQNAPRRQYYGLASDFRVLNLHALVDVQSFDPLRFTLEADFVKNLAFDPARISALQPDNNRGPDVSATVRGPFDGGDTGYSIRAAIGSKEMKKWKDWNLSFGYRYLESDAVPDAFTDSDFRSGGTNSKGFIIGATLGIAKNTNLQVRWLNGNSITSNPYSNDTLQIDINAGF
jgi:Putative porin